MFCIPSGEDRDQQTSTELQEIEPQVDSIATRTRTTSSVMISDEGLFFVTEPEDIEASINKHGHSNVIIDVFNYNLKAEAREKLSFNFIAMIEDFLITLLYPVSILYAIPRFGVISVRRMGFLPPIPKKHRNEGEFSTTFHDPEKPGYQISSFNIFSVTTFLGMLRFTVFISFIMSGVYNIEEGISNAPLYLAGFTFVVVVLVLFSLSNKKAYRTKCSVKRLHMHRERRNEELFSGWLPLPWYLAVFELRLAAEKLGVDIIGGRFHFPLCSEKQLRTALGEKVLAYIEESARSKSDQTQRRCTSPYYYLDDKGEKKEGSSCTALGILLRIALQESHANPAFGEDNDDLWIKAQGTSTWYPILVYLIMVLPFFVAHVIESGGRYNAWSIVLCISSLITLNFSMDG